VYAKYKDKIQIMLITRDEQLAFKMREFKPIIEKPDRLTYPGEVCKLDIALAPVSGQYDRRRSWLKIAEYSACGIPWIATDYEPYHDYNYPGSILVNNKPSLWEEALSMMIEKYDFFYNSAQASHDKWMQDFSIQKNHEFLAKQFNSVLEG
jgi:glycosyltransferase involved in cell wall biosynthesis